MATRGGRSRHPRDWIRSSGGLRATFQDGESRREVRIEARAGELLHPRARAERLGGG
jgi:hypothetical protein